MKKFYKTFFVTFAICFSFFFTPNSWGITIDEFSAFINQISNTPTALTVKPTLEQWESLIFQLSKLYNSNQEVLEIDLTTYIENHLSTMIYDMNEIQLFNFLLATLEAANGRGVFLQALLDDHKMLYSLHMNLEIPLSVRTNIIHITPMETNYDTIPPRQVYYHNPHLNIYIPVNAADFCSCCSLQ